MKYYQFHKIKRAVSLKIKILKIQLFYINYISFAKNEANITVIIPATAMDNELIAPSVSPISRAFEVPMACADEPRPIPFAIGFFILKTL